MEVILASPHYKPLEASGYQNDLGTSPSRQWTALIVRPASSAGIKKSELDGSADSAVYSIAIASASFLS